MSDEQLIVAGGIYCLAFAAFHLAFWKLFRWPEDLTSLSFINSAVMQILNLCLTFVFVIFGVVSLIYPADMTSTPLGRTLLLLISIFWLLRAAEQVVFFGLRSGISVLFFIVFLAGGALYVFPLVH